MGSGMNTIGQSLLGPFASRTPRQFQRETYQTDPFQNLKPQQQFIENTMAQRINQGPMDVSNPYVGPRPEQEAEIAALQGYQRQAEPLYATSVAELQKTAGGGYLDPMEQAPFQRLSAARQNIARDLFQQSMNDTNARAALRGNFDSSTREAQLGRSAGRLDTQAAQDIAQAGWGQYGRERELQEAAAGRGTQLAPGLAGQVFGAGEQLRSAEQQGNTAQLQAQLQAQGMSEAQIQDYLRYMQIASGQNEESIVGAAPVDENLKRLKYVSEAYANVFGGGGGMGAASS